ncbi:MAG: lysophospholipid acyltransferase family protein [Candidatus Krumholzibacteriia bacterium]
MGGSSKRGRWLAEYAALYPLFLLARWLPRRLLVALGRGTGRFVFAVLRVRRAVTLANLRAALGAADDPRRLTRLGALVYANLGATLMEFCKLYDSRPEQIRALVEIEGREHLDACRRQGRGAVLTTGHFGNWELLGAAVSAYGYPVKFLIKDQSNPWVHRLQNEIRRRGGIGVIRVGVGARQVLYALRRREFVGILGDQDAGSGGLFFDFLGREAAVARGVAYFAWRAGVPVIPCHILRLADGRHRAVFAAPIAADPAWDEETAVRDLTRAHTAALAAVIRAHPEHYFWVHRRWKTRPPAAAGG